MTTIMAANTGATKRLDAVGRSLWAKKLNDHAIADIIGCDQGCVTRWRNLNALPPNFKQIMRPNIEAMDAETFAAFLASSRTCNKCGDSLTVADFSITSECGKKVVRTACRSCMKEYFRVRNSVKPKPVKLRRKPARKWAYLVLPAGALFEVRKVTKCGKRLVSRHDREQDAEREVRGLLQPMGERI